MRATAGPMFTTTIMQLLMSWAGTLILASHVPEAEVGIYNALVRISVFTNITILAINSIALPGLRRLGLPATDKPYDKPRGPRPGMIFLSSLPIFLILAIFLQPCSPFSGKTLPDTSSRSICYWRVSS